MKIGNTTNSDIQTKNYTMKTSTLKQKLLFFIFPALILPGLKINAQNDFASGYIIEVSGDTVQGWINQKDYLTSFRECTFKSSPDASTVKYGPTDIRAYHFDKGKMFVSKKVLFHGDSTDLFLECLLDGIADIYFLKENGGPHYFVEKAGFGLQELLVEEKKVTQEVENVEGIMEKKDFLVKHDRYKGVLQAAFVDDRPLYNKINQTPLTPRGLIRISKNYHNDICTDYACIDYTRNLDTKFSYGAKTGVIQSWCEMSDIKGGSADLSMLYGLEMQFHLPFLSKNLGIGVGFLGSANHFHDIFTGPKLEEYNGLDGMDVETRYDILRIPIFLQYSFPVKKIETVIEIGYNNDFHRNIKSSVSELGYWGELPGSAYASSYRYGLFGGAGLKFKLSDRIKLNCMADYIYTAPGTASEDGALYLQYNHSPVVDFISIRSVSLTFGAEFKLNK